MSRAEVAADSPYQFSRPGELAEVVELRPGGTKVPGAETVEPGLAEQAVTGVRQEQKPKIGGAVMEQLVSVGAPRRASRKLQAAPGLGAEGRAADVGAGAAGGGAAAVGAGGGTARAGAAGAGVVGREVPAGVRFAGAMSVGALALRRQALGRVEGEGAVGGEGVGVPEAREWGGRLAQAVAEVLSGDRPAAQLVRFTDEEVFFELNRRVRMLGLSTNASGRVSKERCALRSVRVCKPRAGVAEVAAHVRHGSRSQAIALRMEVRRNRWVCTALEVG